MQMADRDQLIHSRLSSDDDDYYDYFIIIERTVLPGRVVVAQAHCFGLRCDEPIMWPAGMLLLLLDRHNRRVAKVDCCLLLRACVCARGEGAARESQKDTATGRQIHAAAVTIFADANTHTLQGETVQVQPLSFYAINEHLFPLDQRKLKGNVAPLSSFSVVGIDFKNNSSS